MPGVIGNKQGGSLDQATEERQEGKGSQLSWQQPTNSHCSKQLAERFRPVSPGQHYGLFGLDDPLGSSCMLQVVMSVASQPQPKIFPAKSHERWGVEEQEMSLSESHCFISIIFLNANFPKRHTVHIQELVAQRTHLIPTLCSRTTRTHLLLKPSDLIRCGLVFPSHSDAKFIRKLSLEQKNKMKQIRSKVQSSQKGVKLHKDRVLLTSLGHPSSSLPTPSSYHSHAVSQTTPWEPLPM